METRSAIVCPRAELDPGTEEPWSSRRPAPRGNAGLPNRNSVPGVGFKKQEGDQRETAARSSPWDAVGNGIP